MTAPGTAPHTLPTPAGLRLAFYGDDFTGSTDALEVLAFAGLRCALFLAVPSAEALHELGPFDAIGIAGDSRAMSAAEMAAQLPAVLAALARLPTPLVHYKVCSTFDSSPVIGSIGRVMDLARAAFGDGVIPIVAGTPALGRYCIFGNLFARSGTDGQVHRLDRHPIMRVHPVTPMPEADLVRHLAAQTGQQIARFELPNFATDRPAMDGALERQLAQAPGAILFDAASAEHLTEVGRLLDGLSRQRPVSDRPLFSVGSSGLEYAMTQWWRERGSGLAAASAVAGEVAAEVAAGIAVNTAVDPKTDSAQFDAVPQVLAVSGSASGLSALQIDAAVAAGFVDLPVDALALVAGGPRHGAQDGQAAQDWQLSLGQLAERTIQALRQGHSVMLHTARGPQDPRIDAVITALVAGGLSRAQAQHEGGRLLGQRLGQLVDTVLRAVPLRRLLLSGGDTSSQITQRLAPDALLIAARLAPGAPLCRVVSREPHLQQLQIALKGGQMGQADYFVKALRGTVQTGL